MKYLPLLMALPILLSCGCASTPVYQKLPPNAILGLRQQTYIDSTISYDDKYFGHWGKFLIGPDYYRSLDVETYVMSSGDPVSTGLAKKSRLFRWIGGGAGLAGIIVAGATTKGAKDPVFLDILIGSLAITVFTIRFGTNYYLKSAMEPFNKYLRQDLGLTDDGKASQVH